MPHYYLVFGDLHGRILPAFRLALAFQRDHGIRLSGLLQVGDLGYFPDFSRADKATKKHALKDPLEMGVLDIVLPNKHADQLFSDPNVPPGLWFIAGNHEDHEILQRLSQSSGSQALDFPVDHYLRTRCIKDGQVATLPGGLRVGGLWGIDDQAPGARRHTPLLGRIQPRSVNRLAAQAFDILLMHESPRDAMLLHSGSEEIDMLLHLASPAFAFFGHYHGEPRFSETAYAPTRLFHLHGLEFRGPGRSAELGSVGLLSWDETDGDFQYLNPLPHGPACFSN